jgi:protein-tyrosine phosphatase
MIGWTMIQTRRRFAAAALLALAFATGPRVSGAAEPFKIAFVDTGNTGRSLMAETLARDLAARKGLSVAVISRGLDVDPFDEAPELHAQALMTERGFKVAGHVARPLTEGDVAHADLILTMTPGHVEKLVARYPQAKAKTFTLAGYATGADEAIPDAWGKPRPAYDAVIAQLDRFLPTALTKALAAR